MILLSLLLFIINIISCYCNVRFIDCANHEITAIRVKGCSGEPCRYPKNDYLQIEYDMIMGTTAEMIDANLTFHADHVTAGGGYKWFGYFPKITYKPQLGFPPLFPDLDKPKAYRQPYTYRYSIYMAEHFHGIWITDITSKFYNEHGVLLACATFNTTHPLY